MKLYELVGRDPSQGFSPFVWRTKMCLAHKGFDFETVPLVFSDFAEKLAFSGSKTVPVLVDGDNIISDSWDIACYLEETYPDRPSLFGSPAEKALALHGVNVFSYELFRPMFLACVKDIHEMADDRDKDYFRKTREARINMTLEEVVQYRDKNLETFRNLLKPYEATLSGQDYFSGEAPAYLDYVIYGLFQWAKAVSKVPVLKDEKNVILWCERMDMLYNGLGGQLKARA